MDNKGDRRPCMPVAEFVEPHGTGWYVSVDRFAAHASIVLLSSSSMMNDTAKSEVSRPQTSVHTPGHLSLQPSHNILER